MTEKKTYLGSCLCQAVQYKIEGSLSGFYLCHCSRCQKTSGSSNCANAFAKDATLTWISGEQNQKLYTLEGTRFTRNFCLTCGSSLPYLFGENKVAAIPAGSLDTELEISPTAHIFYGSKASWEKNLDQIEKRVEFKS